MMKKLLILLFAINCYVLSGQVNSTPAPTSEEEYNYLTKGYKIQTDSGLDMKKGYILQEVGNVSRGKCDFQFKLLIREAKNEIAAYLVVAHSRNTGRTNYVCIPINNNELLEKYYNDISLWDQVMLGHYSYIVSSILGSMTSSLNELEKITKK
jgi:hypothetical protein